jgi:hypothetical protein
VRCRSPVSGPTPFLWETPEVTTAATAVGQSKMGYLAHRVRHCRNLQQLPQVRCQPPGSGSTHTLKTKQGSPVSRTTPFLWKTSSIPGPPPFLWETPEVTTAATAVGQSKMGYLTHRVRHCRNLQQLPQVRCQPPGSGSAQTRRQNRSGAGQQSRVLPHSCGRRPQ